MQRSRSWRPVRGKGACSNSNWTAQWLQMAARKKLGNYVRRDCESIAIKVCSPIGRGKGVCSDSNWTAQWLQMAAKLRQAWLWIDCNQSLQPNRSQIKCDLSKERASAQIRIAQHSDFRWRRTNALRQCLVWFWIDCNKVCSQIGRTWNAIFESHVVTSVDRSSFDFRFEDFLSNFSL